MQLIDADIFLSKIDPDEYYHKNEIMDIMRDTLSEGNDPLTLEELREMDGEPVWVEIPKGRVAEWCIAKWDPLMGRMRLWGSGGGWFDGRNCGKSVFAYCRRAEEALADG